MHTLADAPELTTQNQVCEVKSAAAVHDAQKMMERGLIRRKTNETKMNAESSRSHAVLTLHLESSTRTASGLLAVKSSRLNLVDLAGTSLARASDTVYACVKCLLWHVCVCSHVVLCCDRQLC